MDSFNLSTFLLEFQITLSYHCMVKSAAVAGHTEMLAFELGCSVWFGDGNDDFLGV